MAAMRRIRAALLLAVFSLSLIAPAVFASPSETNLPACCRRGGKHHCSDVAHESHGPALRATPCAAYPDAGPATLKAFAMLPGMRRSIAASERGEMIMAAALLAHIIRSGGSAESRGPPQFPAI